MASLILKITDELLRKVNIKKDQMGKKNREELLVPVLEDLTKDIQLD